MTDPMTGLTRGQVAEKTARGENAGDSTVRSKSVGRIFADNIFTLFNLINVIIAVLVFLVGAYQEILGNMHNLFGDTNAVHISVDENGYNIEQVIDGETVADVLEYVQYNPKKLVRRLEIWVSKAIKDGKITETEGKEFINNYRAGLYGYTYLE